MPTMMLLARVLSLTPITSSQVMAMTIRNAGRLTSTGTPAIRGAVRMTVCIATLPPAARACAFQYPCVSQSGMWKNGETSELKYPPHAIATATFPTAYSRIRSHPMIHATSSPSVA